MSGILKRVLVLHGYSQNAVMFSKRLGALRKECSRDVDLVFVNAPHILLPSELHGASPAQYDSSGTATDEMQANPETAMRGWWKANKERTQVMGFDDAITSIRDVLKEEVERGGKFDGVLGFSQGAALAAFISSLLERPHLFPKFLVDGKAPHPPFQFCIAVSGFRIMDSICDPAYTPHYTTPTLHVIGRNDVVVVEERSRALVDVSKNRRVEEHDGGHFVPSKASWRKFLADYLRDSTADIPSPEGGPSSSGTSTPSGPTSYATATMRL